MDRSHFRQPHKYWLARISVLFGPLFRILRRCLAVNQSTPPEQWTDLVLIGADHIGDVLYRTVGLSTIKNTYPNCRLHFIASRPAADLLEGHPSLDSVIVAARASEWRSIRDRVRLLRSRRFDAAICYNPNDYWKDQLAVALSGIPNCIGYTHKGLPGLTTRGVRLQFPQPYAAYFRDLVEELTKNTVGTLRPKVLMDDVDREAASAFRDSLSLSGAPMVAASITSRQLSHPAIQRRMLEVLAELQRRENVAIVLLGSVDDDRELRAAARNVGLKCSFATGVLSVREATAFLEFATVAFCLDSGPRHMANAAGVPVVFCRNLQFLKAEAGCYLPTETDIGSSEECLCYSPDVEVPLFSIEDGVSALQREIFSSRR